jgi:hypothetical protein
MGMNLNYSSTIRPNQHEKDEWSRLAQWAYARSWNDLGHTYSVAASLPQEGAMQIWYFDRLQTLYRKWLTDGLSHFESDRFVEKLSVA